jgi:hypothetical protein
MGDFPRIKKGDEMKKLPTLKELEGKYEPEELKDLTDEEVLKIFESVETVWDYEPTEDEKGGVGIERFKNKADYLKEQGNRADCLYYDMAYLNYLKKNEKEFNRSFSLIEDNETRQELLSQIELLEQIDIFP